MDNIIYFNKDFKGLQDGQRENIGIRGRRAVDLASMGLPIAPGFIIDSELTMKLPQVNLKERLKTHIKNLEKDTKKKFGDKDKPLLLKVVISSDLNVPFFPSIHNIGMNDETVKGFANYTNELFAFEEYHYLCMNLAKKVYDFTPEQIDEIENKLPKKATITSVSSAVDNYKISLENNFSQDVYDQLIQILKTASAKYIDSDIDVDNSLSIMVQAMVYGNFGENSYSGSYYTRNIVTGDNKIQGEFLQNEFDFGKAKPKEILKIDKKYYDKFSKIAQKVESNFKEIRNIKFTIEEGDFWLVEQREVSEKSTQAQIRALLDLTSKKIISKDYLVKNLIPNQLNELLHPIIDTQTTKNVPKIQGGIAGATGAAIGRVFFSTPKLLEEHKKAIMHGEDTRFILVMEASFAEDVKAIEISQGVITNEGGFSSHAPVVARSLGKVAMVQPDLKIKANSFILAGKIVKEGDYVSINVPYYEDPTIFLAKVGLIEPNFKKNGLLEFGDIVEEFIDDSPCYH